MSLATPTMRRRSTLRIVKRPSLARVRQAVRLFRGGYAPKAVRKANMRAWLAAIERLGSKWVYAETQTLVRRVKP